MATLSLKELLASVQARSGLDDAWRADLLPFDIVRVHYRAPELTLIFSNGLIAVLELDSDLKFTLVDFVAVNVAEQIAVQNGFFEQWTEDRPQWRPLLASPVWMQGEAACVPLYDACKVVDCAVLDDKIAMLV